LAGNARLKYSLRGANVRGIFFYLKVAVATIGPIFLGRIYYNEIEESRGESREGDDNAPRGQLGLPKIMKGIGKRTIAERCKSVNRLAKPSDKMIY